MQTLPVLCASDTLHATARSKSALRKVCWSRKGKTHASCFQASSSRKQRGSVSWPENHCHIDLYDSIQYQNV